MRTDVNTWVGAYPWRRVPGTSIDDLQEAMHRVGIDAAWVSHLPGLWWGDPAQGNAWLLDCCRRGRNLEPVPSIHPGLPAWEHDLDAVSGEVRAVRADPCQYGIGASSAAMQRLTRAVAERELLLMLAVRLEDGRQRHLLDIAPELAPADVRTLLRLHRNTRLIITHADRTFIEEVHFGSTPEEAARIVWDISWLWGPPEDQLSQLVETIGADRFVFGSGQPLRTPETPLARLELSGLEEQTIRQIESENLARFTQLP